VPQAEDETEQHKLDGVVSAIDQPQGEGALSELVVDAEACRNEVARPTGSSGHSIVHGVLFLARLGAAFARSCFRRRAVTRSMRS